MNQQYAPQNVYNQIHAETMNDTDNRNITSGPSDYTDSLNSLHKNIPGGSNRQQSDSVPNANGASPSDPFNKTTPETLHPFSKPSVEMFTFSSSKASDLSQKCVIEVHEAFETWFPKTTNMSREQVSAQCADTIHKNFRQLFQQVCEPLPGTQCENENRVDRSSNQHVDLTVYPDLDTQTRDFSPRILAQKASGLDGTQGILDILDTTTDDIQMGNGILPEDVQVYNNTLEKSYGLPNHMDYNNSTLPEASILDTNQTFVIPFLDMHSDTPNRTEPNEYPTTPSLHTSSNASLSTHTHPQDSNVDSVRGVTHRVLNQQIVQPQKNQEDSSGSQAIISSDTIEAVGPRKRKRSNTRDADQNGALESLNDAVAETPFHMVDANSEALSDPVKETTNTVPLGSKIDTTRHWSSNHLNGAADLALLSDLINEPSKTPSDPPTDTHNTPSEPITETPVPQSNNDPSLALEKKRARIKLKTFKKNSKSAEKPKKASVPESQNSKVVETVGAEKAVDDGPPGPKSGQTLVPANSVGEVPVPALPDPKSGQALATANSVGEVQAPALPNPLIVRISVPANTTDTTAESAPPGFKKTQVFAPINNPAGQKYVQTFTPTSIPLGMKKLRVSVPSEDSSSSGTRNKRLKVLVPPNRANKTFEISTIGYKNVAAPVYTPVVEPSETDVTESKHETDLVLSKTPAKPLENNATENKSTQIRASDATAKPSETHSISKTNGHLSPPTRPEHDTCTLSEPPHASLSKTHSLVTPTQHQTRAQNAEISNVSEKEADSTLFDSKSVAKTRVSARVSKPSRISFPTFDTKQMGSERYLHMEIDRIQNSMSRSQKTLASLIRKAIVAKYSLKAPTTRVIFLKRVQKPYFRDADRSNLVSGKADENESYYNYLVQNSVSIKTTENSSSGQSKYVFGGKFASHDESLDLNTPYGCFQKETRSTVLRLDLQKMFPQYDQTRQARVSNAMDKILELRWSKSYSDAAVQERGILQNKLQRLSEMKQKAKETSKREGEPSLNDLSCKQLEMQQGMAPLLIQTSGRAWMRKRKRQEIVQHGRLFKDVKPNKLYKNASAMSPLQSFNYILETNKIEPSCGLPRVTDVPTISPFNKVGYGSLARKLSHSFTIHDFLPSNHSITAKEIQNVLDGKEVGHVAMQTENEYSKLFNRIADSPNLSLFPMIHKFPCLITNLPSYLLRSALVEDCTQMATIPCPAPKNDEDFAWSQTKTKTSLIKAYQQSIREVMYLDVSSDEISETVE